MYLSRSVSCVASGKPSMRSATCPFLNRMIVGNASTLNLDAMFGYFSVSILTSETLSLPTAVATCGNTCLLSSWQGPHHVA